MRRFRRAWAGNGRWGILVTIVAVSTLFAAGVGVYLKTRPPPFAPLQYSATPQNVLGTKSRVDVWGASLVVIDYDGVTRPLVRVTGSKCNNASDPVHIIGTKQIRSIKPPGATFADAPIDVQFPPGCLTRDETDPWVNGIPDEALTRVKDLAHAGINVSVWQYAGFDTPYTADGTRGVEAAWQTDSFAIRYTGS